MLINCGRGGLLDLDSAYDALLDGLLRGIGLDVFDPEPPHDHPLVQHPDVVLTPHVMALSRRARALVFEEMAAGMDHVFVGTCCARGRRQPRASMNPRRTPSSSKPSTTGSTRVDSAGTLRPPSRAQGRSGGHTRGDTTVSARRFVLTDRQPDPHLGLADPFRASRLKHKVPICRHFSCRRRGLEPPTRGL